MQYSPLRSLTDFVPARRPDDYSQKSGADSAGLKGYRAFRREPLPITARFVITITWNTACVGLVHGQEARPVT
jgi:hypothetical protein